MIHLKMKCACICTECFWKDMQEVVMCCPRERAEQTDGGRGSWAQGGWQFIINTFFVFSFSILCIITFFLWKGACFLFVLFCLRKQILSIKKMTMTFSHSATSYQLIYTRIKCKWGRGWPQGPRVIEQLNSMTKDLSIPPLCRLSMWTWSSGFLNSWRQESGKWSNRTVPRGGKEAISSLGLFLGVKKPFPKALRHM